MDIAPLSAELCFPPLSDTPDNLAFSFDVKKAAMRAHVVKRWEWDDDYQIKVHLAHFREKPFFAIEQRGKKVGTFSLQQEGGFVRFGEFYLYPEEQQRGLGTVILRHCLQIADKALSPVRLEYLKWNPVGSLYLRHGFAIIGETDIHWLMERPLPIKAGW